MRLECARNVKCASTGDSPGGAGPPPVKALQGRHSGGIAGIAEHRPQESVQDRLCPLLAFLAILHRENLELNASPGRVLF
jgi:hypothetical protein